MQQRQALIAIGPIVIVAASLGLASVMLPLAGHAAEGTPPPVAASSGASSSAAASSSSSAAATTSAALSSSPAASARAPAAVAPAATLPVAPVPVASMPAGDDATGKPPASVLKSGLLPKKLARAKHKSKLPANTAATAAVVPAESPSVFDALFGNGQPPADAAVPADPATTAATSPIGTVTGKSKKGKGVKSAKNVVAPGAAVATAIADDGFFNGDDVPTASAELGQPLLSPGNIEPTKTAIKRYADLVAHGGWPTVPPLQMQIGTSNPAVAVLRQRLAAEGDLTAQPSGFSGPEYFDQDVADAVHQFQYRYGLTETGDLMDTDKLKNGTRTVAAMNVPAEARLAQLKANLTRLQAKPMPKGRYVLVNIPSEQIEAVDGNKVALRLNGVVGKPDRPSPLLTSSIEEVKFNPVWTLPPTVVREDLIPKGQSLQAKGVDVLAKFGIDAYDGSGKKLDSSTINWAKVGQDTYRFSEQPNKDNPLGFAKLDFASPESVYMHDTPSAKLFDKSYRAASSGCIRVDHMERLVAWLLKETDGWGPGHVRQMKDTGESKIVHLKHGVALNWVYVTAWATEDGIAHFRRDLYGKDQAFGVSKTASAY